MTIILKKFDRFLVGESVLSSVKTTKERTMTTTAAAIAKNAALKLKIAEMERKQRDIEAAKELVNENQILAQRLRDLKKAAAESKKTRKTYTRQKPYNVHSNPYMKFLKGAREGL